MKITIARRGICYILIFSFLLSFCACESKQEDALPDRNLVVETVDVAYDAVEVTSYTLRLRSLYTRIRQLLKYPAPGEEENESTKQYIRNEIIPLLQRLQVTQYELDQLLYFGESLCKTAEKSGAAIALKMLEASYQNCIGVLGSRRAGKLLYHASLLYVLAKQKENNEDNAAYGEIHALLQDVLDENTFATAAVFTYYTISLLDSAESKDLQVKLTDSELRLLLIHQANAYQSDNLTTKQWQAAGKVFSFLGIFDFIDIDSQELPAVMWESICQEGTLLPAAFATMPELLALYDAFANELTDAETALLRSQNKDNCISAILSVSARIEKPLEQYLCSLTLALQDVSDDSEAQCLRALGLWEDYLSYAENREHISYRELVKVICKENQDRTEIVNCFENYLFSICPYFTFSIFHERSTAP